MKPIFYMDVDGVLNLFAGAAPGIDVEYVALPGSTWEVILRRDRFDVIARLEEVFEMRWASMWQDSAPAVFAPAAGFGQDWPYIPFTKHASSGGMPEAAGVIDYKIPGIEADAAGRPFVWADDDFEDHHGAWAARSRAFLITTDPREGLAMRHVEEACLKARLFL